MTLPNAATLTTSPVTVLRDPLFFPGPSPTGGRLFHHWERLTPTDAGRPALGEESAPAPPACARALTQSAGMLGACLTEAPAFASRRRRRQTPRHVARTLHG